MKVKVNTLPTIKERLYNEKEVVCNEGIYKFTKRFDSRVVTFKVNSRYVSILVEEEDAQPFLHEIWPGFTFTKLNETLELTFKEKE